MNLAGKNRAEGLLAAVIIARSTSFVFNNSHEQNSKRVVIAMALGHG